MDQDDLADLTTELGHLLDAWDPIGVADLVADEYLALTGLLLERLGRGDDRASICQLLYEVAPQYGADPEDADRFGARIHAWFVARQARS